MTDTMTVKELAETAGVNDRTIRRAIKDVLKMETRQGVEIRLDHAQCLQIVGAMRVKGDKQLRQNAEALRQNADVPSQNGKVLRQGAAPEIIKAFSDALQVMNRLATECAESNAMTRKLIEKMASVPVIAPPEQEYSTVAGYCRRNGIRFDLETAKRFGKVATAISQERGYPIRKISDERWGEVNAYHVSVLAQAVSA